jgi:nucleotide-binding universal stress UspA family protein
MMAVQKVLVATDFSEQSRIAIRRAAQICLEHGAQLNLLHVVEDLPTPEFLSSDQHLEKAKRQLENEVVSAPQGMDCRCQIETGKIFSTIIRSARKIMADLIVVGAHGHHSLRDNFLGTTAEKLVHKMAFPILVVKQPFQSAYRRVLVPTDFSDASRQALSATTLLAPGAGIDLLHVYGIWGEEQLSMAGAGEKAEQYRQRTELWAMTSMDKWRLGIDLAGHPVRQYVRKGYASSAIAQFAANRKNDLVAMGTVRRSGVFNVLLGNVTENTLRTVPCDILIVPQNV